MAKNKPEQMESLKELLPKKDFHPVFNNSLHYPVDKIMELAAEADEIEFMTIKVAVLKKYPENVEWRHRAWFVIL